MGYGKRLFNNHVDLTIEEVGNYINKYIDNHLDYLEDSNNLTKWTSLPKVFLQSDKDKRMYLDEVIYIDNLFMDEESKIRLFNSLGSLLVQAKISIYKVDKNSLFLLVDYFSNIPIDDYNYDIRVLGSSSLLETIRRTTLDLDYRKLLVDYIINKAHEKNVDINDVNSIKAFQKESIKELKETEWWHLIEPNPYMQISYVDTSKFGH